ncbi:MAG: SDR family oxidoreductase [Anaerolineae bacterium]|nr:SDR family oxidoreductase [Anaerolineae bacterium]
MFKTVLITGCSTGLGRTAAKKFAAEGWNVVATMRKPDNSLAAENPDNVLVTALDVTDVASIEAAIAEGVARFGQIDVVVNNAGISTVTVLEATPPETIRRIFETNVFGPINVIRAMTPRFRAQGGGVFVNVSSAVGIAAAPLLSIYVATKHALEGLSESLSYELESQNIRLKLVEPGTMQTTNFAQSTLATLQDIPMPPAYKPYFDHMMQAMLNSPLEVSDEEQVAATIFDAAGDPSSRLRYVSGPDAEAMTKLRWSTSEEHYLATMRDMAGQTTWLNRIQN